MTGPVWVPATGLRPGLEVRRWDTGEHLYAMESVTATRVRGVDYVVAECRHTDGSLRPHYWRPTDAVLVLPERN